ncbi:very long chain fatty acid elongase 4-like [Ostrinia nubilalis]|uniref:very long chain fatty acid elongase 4-like n=1 Tax=Ostrinia nubilalis TaxID=29057 RepID=UPI00308262B1
MEAKPENGVEYSFWDFKGQADYVDSWFLMGTPYLPLLIIVMYLLFVLKTGPEFMRDREPMKLRNVLVAYNAFQVMVSSYLVYLSLDGMIRFGVFHRICLFENEEIRKEALSSSYWFLLAKVTELVDTVFFVLRKKQNQVTFLHVYHHTLTMVVSWLMVKYGKTDDLIFLGGANSFVHVVMYAYYGLSVFPGIAKYLWWKKYLTKLQLIQFVAIIVHLLVNSFISKCPPSKLVIAMVFFNATLFLYLFSDFYVKAYMKSRRDKKNSSLGKDVLNGSLNRKHIMNGNTSKKIN